MRIILQGSVFCLALAMASARAASVPDSFDGEDPFAVLDAVRPGVDSAVGGELVSTDTKSVRIKTEGSVYLKNTLNNLNRDSRVDPGHRMQLIEENLTVLETRLTLSDILDMAKQWRWLFKGFNAASGDRESSGSLRDEARIDELFVDRKSEQWFASIGKRRINWGHAQGFNPVNVVVPPRAPLDPGRETEGQPMLWINRADGAQSMDMVMTRNYDREYRSDQNRGGLKWSFAAAKSDYALYYFDGVNYRDGRAYERMLGGSFSADVFPGVTLYMEGARFGENYRNYYDAANVRVNKDGAYWQGVAGTGLGLGGKARVNVEYFYNGQGYSNTERVNYFRTADAQPAESTDTSITNDYLVTGMNRNYVLASYQDEFRERYTWDISTLIPGDQSYSLRAQGKYVVSDDYELWIVWLHNDGSRASEFGNALVSNALEFGVSVGF